jgi:predicted dehydrogenase
MAGPRRWRSPRRGVHRKQQQTGGATVSRINRRGFLKQSLGAAGAIALGGCAAEAKRRPWVVFPPPPRRGANEEIRVAVVGAGGMGRGHVAQHTHAKGVRVVAICDADERRIADRSKIVTEAGDPKPTAEPDIRRLLDRKDIDVISSATPNHWHALVTVWACQAGKDVYIQKPASHEIFEGWKMVEAARKYKRVVQHGTQSRSRNALKEAIQMLHDGVIGEVYMARALCYKRRDSIAGPSHRLKLAPDGSVPSTFHWNLWQGPAQEKPFSTDYVHYNWHWFWDYGNGDIGNQGVHQMDVAMWGLGKDGEHPIRAISHGGRFTYDDGAQTPNTQVASMQYADGKMLVFEVRGRETNDEWGVKIGNLFYGSKGYMAVRGGDKCEFMVHGEPGPKTTSRGGNEWENFHNAVRAGDPGLLNAEIAKGHHSATLCHLANIAYRLKRSVDFDPKSETFGNDAEANALLKRDYRKGFAVPDKV